MKNGALGGSFINTAVRAQAGGARERWLERIGRAPGHLGRGAPGASSARIALLDSGTSAP